MTPWDRIQAGAIWGGGLGALLLSLLTLLWWAVFSPGGLKDGQFVLIFYLFTLPFGALLGVVAGVTRALLEYDAKETAGGVCFVGGAVVAVLAVLYSLFWPGT